jgi:hypothetical protein
MSAEDPQPGDVLTAGHFQAALGKPREIKNPRAAGERYGASASSFGHAATRIERQEFWILLTGGGSGGAYSWSEQVPDGGGTWVAGGRSGTASEDPAREVNGNSSLAADSSLRAWARRDHDGVLRFELGVCS